MKKFIFSVGNKNKLFKVTALTALTLCLPAMASAYNANANKVEMSQQKADHITGTVTDTNGEPVIGATIKIVGSSNGTVTDVNGKFTLNATQNTILHVSSVGFSPKEVKVVGSSLNIVLKEDTNMLSEVVAIGYGNQRKQDLSTAVASVKIDQSMKSRPSNLASMLQGAMPGVMVQNNGGDPLSEASLSIRGRGSRGTDHSYNSGDGVLYIVDGVPGAPYNIEDIETITVLKDAASAAIYGASVGSGGVVVITTKQAKEGKIKVNFNISKSIKSAINLPTTLTAEQYNKVWADAVKIYGGKLPSTANPAIYPYGNVTRTDWVDAIFRKGYLEHYAISFSGGTSNLKGFASISYDKDTGILNNTFANKLGSKGNIDFQINKWLKLSEQVTYQLTNGQGNIGTGHEGVLPNAIFFPRSATLYDTDEEGNILYDEYKHPLYHGTTPRWAAAKGISGYGEFRNPLAMLQRLDQKRPTHKLFSTTSLELKPITALTLKSQFTSGLIDTEFDEFIHKIPEPGNQSEENRHNIEHSRLNNWLWENIATYAEVFGNTQAILHHITGTQTYHCINIKVAVYIWSHRH